MPKGYLVKDGAELEKALSHMMFPLMMKAQVPVGGRGKAGAVIKIMDRQQAIDGLSNLKGMNVRGFKVDSVLIEEFAPHDEEMYLAISIDRAAGMPNLICGKKGGMEVEVIGHGHIKQYPIDPLEGPDDGLTEKVMLDLGLTNAHLEMLSALISKLWSFYSNYDCELVEVNPLVLQHDGFVCLDAKVVIDDDSLFRHPELSYLKGRDKSPFEIECGKRDLTGVELAGEIGVIANGAGLTMAVLDELERIGLKGAAFIDLGGTDDPARIADAISMMRGGRWVPNIKGILICVFGGITRCEVVADGIISSLPNGPSNIPMIVRLRGVNELQGRSKLRGSGLDAYLDLEEACLALRSVIRGGT